jgi:proton glutamate symport protein
MLNGQLLQTLIASIIFGCSVAKIAPKYKKIVLENMEALLETMFQFVNIIIWAAPVGVMFSIANAIAKNGGISVLGKLANLVLCLYGALAFMTIVVFGAIMLVIKVNPFEFLNAMKDPLILAFTTATSEAALPKAFESLEKFGVEPRISSFVLPFGYSFNLDGSTLYLALASVFCAQAAGIEKTIVRIYIIYLSNEIPIV